MKLSFVSVVYLQHMNPIYDNTTSAFFFCFTNCYFLHSLKELASTRDLSEILTAEEASVYGVTSENSTQPLDGEAHPEDPDKSSQPESENVAKYVSVREEMYKKAKEYESKIIGFELAIRRPYFHVKPLDNPELENWHNYLDFMEKEEDTHKVWFLHL